MERRPAITVVGTVTDDGTHLRVGDWAIGLCLANCSCHVHPVTRRLHILENEKLGLLGLMSFRAGGSPCPCCAPWTAEELLAVVRDFDAIAAMDVSSA